AWSILERLGRFDGSSNLPYPISFSQSCPFYGSRHHLFCMDRKNARRILAILAGRYPDRWARERYAASPFSADHDHPLCPDHRQVGGCHQE
ncbi:MAG TPA: hypothetical protein PK955_10085, partial [Methanoregulaceae archaeon]|nr:hypothetical protein [Methanoregulaceae archaeon]